jgi:L-amino acid N-acyltransferase YncA
MGLDGTVEESEPAGLVSCTCERHGEGILQIFNEAILNSTAVYDYRPRTPEVIRSWLETKSRAGLPVIGIEDERGELSGFATYGSFRERPAYKYSVEHSVYVRSDRRRKGLGLVLLSKLIDAARSQDRHVMIGGIDVDNAASIALHRKLGFSHAGTIRHAGYKFGRWLDLAFYQLILATPARAVDG